MERWATNRTRFQNMEDVEVLPKIKRKIEKISTYINLWLVKCIRCKKPGHTKLTCKVTPASQQEPTQASQQAFQ